MIVVGRRPWIVRGRAGEAEEEWAIWTAGLGWVEWLRYPRIWVRGDGKEGVEDWSEVVGKVIESALGSALDVLTAGRIPVELLSTNEEAEPGVDEANPKLKFPSVASLFPGKLARKLG